MFQLINLIHLYLPQIPHILGQKLAAIYLSLQAVFCVCGSEHRAWSLHTVVTGFFDVLAADVETTVAVTELDAKLVVDFVVIVALVTAEIIKEIQLRLKCTNYETCAILHRFHNLHIAVFSRNCNSKLEPPHE